MLSKARNIIQLSVNGLINIYDNDSFTAIESGESCDQFASPSIEDNTIEYLQEYENYYLNNNNKENKKKGNNVQDNSTTTIATYSHSIETNNNDEDSLMDEIERCSTKGKKRRFTATTNVNKIRSFVSARQNVTRETSKKNKGIHEISCIKNCIE